MIRIAHLITRMTVGGAQENTVLTCLGLAKNRYQVDLISGQEEPGDPTLTAEAEGQGQPVTFVPELRRNLHPWYDLIAVIKLYRLFRQERYDVVHTHSSKAGIVGRLAARLAGVPVIIHTVHGWGFTDYDKGWRKRLFVTLEKWVEPWTRRMVVVTNRDRDKGLREGISSPEKYVQVRSAIPLDQFEGVKIDRAAKRGELGIPAQAPVVGTVARISAQKAPLDFVRVARHVADAVPEVRFLVVGDGDLGDTMKALVHEVGLSDRFVFTGVRRDIPDLMAVMDCFVLTSLWEGLPRTIPQAMAVGVPVVATKVDGILDVVQDGVNGLLADPHDVTLIAQHILRVLGDTELAESLVSQGRERVHVEFDVRRMVAMLAEIYESELRQVRRIGAV